MCKNVSYKGVDLKPWVKSLTWDKDGSCFGWSAGGKLYAYDYSSEWLRSPCFTRWRCESFTALDVEPFKDDSWKDLLVKL